MIVRLATSPYGALRGGAAGLVGLPEENLLRLAEDPDPRVRAAAVNSRSWPRLPPEARARAGADHDPRVREAVGYVTRAERPLPSTVPAFLAETDDESC